ncbi:hypothetical protein ACILFQ_08115 [Capnocytophaga canimorsus]|uniref:hypothetical protein n=1 Tax=Capnocytophaga canimorsus TaxID=28188 RepID=UPI0037D5DC0A
MNILSLHPELSPFIGKQYRNVPCKVLFVGESHYLPSAYDNRIGAEWYSQSTASYGFTSEALAYLNTAQIICNDVIASDFKNKSHSIYRNIGNVYGEVFGKGDYRSALEFVAFSNYFLRPAEVCGGSIVVNDTDAKVSYQHLTELYKQLQPQWIIFVSKKAYETFCAICNDAFLLEKSEVLPHPSCAWWNTPSASYGNLSGKEKLKRLLNSHHL